MRRHVKLGILAALFMLGGVTLFGLGGTQKAYSLSNDAPDSSDFATNNAYYTISNTHDVADNTLIGLSAYHDGASRPTSNVTVTFTFQTGTQQGAEMNLQGFGAARFVVEGHTKIGPYNANKGSVKLTVVPSDWVKQGSNGWSVHVQANMVPDTASSDDSNHLNFKASISGSNNFIGPDGTYYQGVLQGSYSCSGTNCTPLHYKEPFAPPCNLPSGTKTAVILKDLDNPNAFIQPSQFKLKVQIIDKTTGIPVNDNDWSDNNNRNHGDDSLEANGGKAYFWFDAIGTHKYELSITGVSSLNVLQLKIPYDSTSALQTCAVPNSPPSGSITSTCNTDGTGTYDFNFSDPDGSTTAAVTVNYAGGRATSTDTYSTGHYIRTVNDTDAGGPWTVKMVVQDRGGGSDKTYTDSANCYWALSSTGTVTPKTAYDGQVVNFTFNTKNTGGVRTSTFQYGDRLQYYKGSNPVGVITSKGSNASTSLAAGASTSGAMDTWAYTLDVGSAPAGVTKLCAWRTANLTSSNNNTDSKSNPLTACVTIASPSCRGVTFTPGAVESTVKFDVKTSMSFNSLANAQSAMAGSNYYIQITGPEDADGNEGPSIYNNPNVTGADLSVTGNASSGSITGYARNLGPTNTTGMYDVHYGISGGVAPQDCPVVQFPIGNLPYFGVEGGDISAGTTRAANDACLADPAGGIESWNYDNEGGVHPGYYGAGTQAAAYALANIRSFVSGNNPTGNTNPLGTRSTSGALQTTKGSPTPYDYSFANSGTGVIVGSGGYGGSFGSLPCPANYVSQISSGDDTWSDDYSTSGTYNLLPSNGTQVLNAGTLQVADGKGVVINIKVTGDVFINGDIQYDDSAGPGSYPRLNVFATGNIYVAPNVSELHGLFAAQDGTFATCATYDNIRVTERIGYNTCNNNLIVYGSVASKLLHLERTSGSLTSNSGPAERFMYGPELWLATPDCAVNSDDSVCGGSKAPDYDSFTSLPPVL